jgi:hypothetical protein
MEIKNINIVVTNEEEVELKKRIAELEEEREKLKLELEHKTKLLSMFKYHCLPHERRLSDKIDRLIEEGKIPPLINHES